MVSLVNFLLRLLFRFKVFGREHVQADGPVLLIPNHVSWLDFIFVGACLDSDWRFVTSSTTAETSWLHRRIMRSKRCFAVDPGSPYAVKHIAEYLRQGGRLVLFAEGRISSTGSLMKLFEGTGFLLLKTHAKVIPCYLRGANRLVVAGHGGWKQWFPKISVHFGAAQEPPQRQFATSIEGRRKLTVWLRDRVVHHQYAIESEFGPDTVLDAVIQNRYDMPGAIALEDASFKNLSYSKLLVGIELLAQKWHRVLGHQTKPVGVILPNVNATPVTLLSLWASDYVPAILNYTSSAATVATYCQVAGINTVITSRLFLERARLDFSELEKREIRIIYLEDVRSEIGLMNRIQTLVQQKFRSPFRDRHIAPNESAVVLFTSGSEGIPKGVELTQANLMANIRQMLSVIDITDSDRVFNALPMFHSFGLTIGTLLPLVRGLYVVLYPSPLHYRMVPAMIYDRDCTIMLGTNTFLNGYARKAHMYDFQSIRYLFAGAEKTQKATFETWATKYGIRILEGYGATECSPCISLNTRMEAKIGSAGRFLPEVQYRLENVNGVDRGGRLFVKGPNVMKGYLNAEANAAFRSLEGWYDTGDIAEVGEDGFLQILGRLKRFAKISGEMISLTAVEESLAGHFEHLGGLRTEVAIIAQADPLKGEKLVAVANHPAITLQDIRKLLLDAGHSPLSVPRQLITVSTIPKLGTGKIDHRQLSDEVLTAAE